MIDDLLGHFDALQNKTYSRPELLLPRRSIVKQLNGILFEMICTNPS